MGVISSQITNLAIVFSTVYSGAEENNHHSTASLAIVLGIHRWPVISPHKWPVTRKMFPFDDIIMENMSSPISQHHCLGVISNVYICTDHPGKATIIISIQPFCHSHFVPCPWIISTLLLRIWSIRVTSHDVTFERPLNYLFTNLTRITTKRPYLPLWWESIGDLLSPYSSNAESGHVAMSWRHHGS